KHKLTEDNGILTGHSLANDIEALHSMETGFYYRSAIPIDNYSNISKAGFLEILENYNVKHILFRPYNSTRQFLKIFYNTWSDWEEVGNNQTDTGWIPFNVDNGAKTNTAYPTRIGFESAYRIIKNGDVTERYLRINGSNVDHTQVIAQLPSTSAKNVHIGFIRTPLAHNGSSIIIETTGEVRIYIEKIGRAHV